MEDGHKPKALDYLSKGSQQKESARDFIDNARKILMSQISINNKSEVTEILQEYIVMEREKLSEGKKTFQEDKDKYQKYKEDLSSKSNSVAEEAAQAQKEIENLQLEITELKKQEANIDTQQSRCNEQLKQYL